MTMLEKQGILTKEEKDQIIEGLESICRDVENKTLEITEEYEDIHRAKQKRSGRFGYEALYAR